MSDIGLQLNPGSLPYNCYPANPQTLYADMFARGSALFPSITGVVVSASAPPAADQDKLWIKTSGGAPVGQYIFYNGSWVWPHAVPAGDSERRLWVGTLAALVTYDGGDSGAAGPASGAMWERDTQFNDRAPMGANITVGVGGTEGASTQTLLAANIPPHNHPIPIDGTTGNPTDSAQGCHTVGGTNIDYEFATIPNSLGLTRNQSSTPATAFSIQSPVVGAYFIKRTSRVYYRGSP